MGFGKKDKDAEKKAEDAEREQTKAKKAAKDDEVDTTTGPITAATTSGFIIGM